jgi:hypothetical protein
MDKINTFNSKNIKLNSPEEFHDNQNIDDITKLLNLINNYENNINKTYDLNNKRLNIYKNMLNDIIFEYHITCEKNIY